MGTYIHTNITRNNRLDVIMQNPINRLLWPIADKYIQQDCNFPKPRAEALKVHRISPQFPLNTTEQSQRHRSQNLYFIST